MAVFGVNVSLIHAVLPLQCCCTLAAPLDSRCSPKWWSIGSSMSASVASTRFPNIQHSCQSHTPMFFRSNAAIPFSWKQQQLAFCWLQLCPPCSTFSGCCKSRAVPNNTNTHEHRRPWQVEGGKLIENFQISQNQFDGIQDEQPHFWNEERFAMRQLPPLPPMAYR